MTCTCCSTSRSPARASADGRAPEDGASGPAEDDDVRALTRPLWDLTENAVAADGFAAPPTVRFIWGKSWNIPGVVLHVAERLERFNADGAPAARGSACACAGSRSPSRARRPAGRSRRSSRPRPIWTADHSTNCPAVDMPVDNDGLPLNALDQIADDHYGDPGLWAGPRRLSTASTIPLNIPEGTTIVLPPLAILLEATA
jgi:hypothetical protein